MRMYRLIAAVLAVAALAGGCASSRQHVVEDAWFRGATREMYGAAAQVPSADIHPVTNARREEAALMLAEVSAVRIPSERAADLVGVTVDANGSYLLVRGLCAGCGTGKFYAFANEEYLIVDHLGLANRDTEAVRWPVVLQISLSPSDVYVRYSAIQ